MSPVIVRAKAWLEVDGRFVMGEGALELFEGLERDGSLTRAAARIGWSYRHAWGYIRRAERALGIKLTVNVPGKGRLKGTALAPAARPLLELLADARRRTTAAAAASSATLSPDWRRP